MSIDLDKINKDLNIVKNLAARVIINQIISRGQLDHIQEAEFQVYSQFGDDGIIQYLISQLDISEKTFIEFGVENYAEANTRFLLINNNWKGLVIDGDKENINFIKQDTIYWKYDLTAVEAFVDQKNINKIFLENSYSGDIGILSIDVDGNDYWIWDAINVINPVVVIVEYNSVFGNKNAITIPYDPQFMRTKVHYSNLYWGCSLKALCLVAEKKGYYFIGSNSNGNNAYFIRRDKIGKIKPQTIAIGYVESKYRESRDKNGNLTYISGEDRLRVIEDMIVYDVTKDCLIKIREL